MRITFSRRFAMYEAGHASGDRRFNETCGAHSAALRSVAAPRSVRVIMP